MVEERAAECTLKEVVAQHEFRGNVPQAQRVLSLCVVAHGQPASVGPGDESIIATVVDLHLILIENVPQVASDQTQRQIFAVWPLEREGSVGQVFLKLLACRVGHAVNGLRPDLQHTTPGGRQFGQ